MWKQLLLVTLAMPGSIAVAAEASDDQTTAVLEQRFQLYLGGFFPNVSSEITINGEVLPPAPGVDFEEVLGIEDSKAVLWGGARWRISRRNSLEFEFFNLDRTGSTTVASEPIQIGDSVIQAGAEVDSTVDISLGRLTYGFAVYRTERAEVSLKAGLHLLDAKAGIQATGAVCVDGEVPPNCSVFGSTPREESESISAPLPHIGASFIYGFTPELAMRLSAIGFAVDLDAVDGSILEVDADLMWNPWKNFGFGLGLRYFKTKVESEGSRLDGKFEFNYLGPTLYGAVTF